MKIILSNAEKEKIIYDILRNIIPNDYFEGHGIEIYCDEKDYLNAKATLSKCNEPQCVEDIWIHVLQNGGELKFVDKEGNGENNSSFSWVSPAKGFSKIPTFIVIMILYEDPECDVVTYDIALQSILYGKIIYDVG